MGSSKVDALVTISERQPPGEEFLLDIDLSERLAGMIRESGLPSSAAIACEHGLPASGIVAAPGLFSLQIDDRQGAPP